MHAIIRTLLLTAAILSSAAVAQSNPRAFEDDVERIEEALRSNPGRVLPGVLDSCRQQLGYAERLYLMGMETRAQRFVDNCITTLKIPEDASVEKIVAISQEQLAEDADREYRQAMALTPNIDNGLAIYRQCAACHAPEGWGKPSGSVPQIAGQHKNVVIRQLADFRSGNRDSVVMIPYASPEAIGGAQAVADVAAYIDSLEINVENGKGPGDNLVLGEQLYSKFCAGCHGSEGEGSNEERIPRIQAQHYRYLVRQLEWIRDGQRRNAKEEMVDTIQGFEDAEISAIMDYVSRLAPPEEFRAPPGWKNPDFK